jgi:hypothetical protein
MATKILKSKRAKGAAVQAPATPPTKAKTASKTKRDDGCQASGIRTTSSLTEGMTTAQKAEVEALMRAIPEQWSSYKTRRTDLGCALRKLQAAFASAGKNGRFTRCLTELQIPRATAYGLIERYESVQHLPETLLQSANEAGLDLAAPRTYARLDNIRFSRADLTKEKAQKIINNLLKKTERHKNPEFGPGITEQEKKAYRLFNAMRKATGDLDAKEKKVVLQAALNLYAKYENVCTEPEQFTITPTAAEDDWVLQPARGKTAQQAVKS